MRVDIHTHYRTARYLELMEELGAFSEIAAFGLIRTQIRSQVGIVPDDAHVAERLDDMDAAGIDVQVLSIGAYHPYFADPRSAVSGARITNDMHVSLIDRHPDRFRFFGCLPLPHIEESLEEIATILDDPRGTGINLGCSAGGVPLDDPRFDDVWTELDRRAAVVFIHPGTADQLLIGSNEFHLAPDFGAPAELSVALARLIVSGHTTRFPRVRIIAAMTGGLLPQMLDRYEHGLRQSNPEIAEALGGIAGHLREMYFDTSIMEEPAVLDAAVRRFGAGALVLGSDYGRPRVTSDIAVAYVEAATCLDDRQKAGVLGDTAAALLGIQPGTPPGEDVTRPAPRV